MLSPQQEMRNLLYEMLDISSDPRLVKAVDRISTICQPFLADDPKPNVDRRLTPSQERILSTLLAKRGHTVTYEQITGIYLPDPSQEGSEGSLKVMVHNLRKRLKGTPYEDKIQTEWGRGYRMVA